MKRLLFCLTLLSLLIAGTLGAYKIIEVPEAVARMQVVVAGGSVPVAGCSVSTDYIGNKAVEATTGNIPGFNYLSAFAFTPTLGGGCTSGKWTTAYIYSVEDYGATAKVCIYSSAGSAATPNNVGNVLISCSGNMTGAATTWKSSAMDTAGAPTAGTTYWIATMAKTNDWRNKYNAAGIDHWYHACTGCGDSPPANLADATLDAYTAGSWYQETATPSLYVTVGP